MHITSKGTGFLNSKFAKNFKITFQIAGILNEVYYFVTVKQGI